LENVALHPGGLADVIASVAEFIMPHAIEGADRSSSGVAGHGASVKDLTAVK
jgi:hypothetical protein